MLVTGGSGYLGRTLAPLAAQHVEALCHTYYSNPPPDVAGAYRLDVRSAGQVHALVDDFAPDVIIHCAGSSGRPTTVEVIIAGAEHITAAAAQCGARLIHLSTDVVFDGRQAPYREEDVPKPLHDYGRAKARAEAIVRRYANHVIVRTSLIYGLQEMDHSTKWIVNGLRQGKTVTLFTDQYRNPIWADSLSKACLELASHDYSGILHVAGNQRLSRAQFGLRMLDWWQVHQRNTLVLGPGDGERWPADCVLDIRRAQQLLNTKLPGVDDILSGARRLHV